MRKKLSKNKEVSMKERGPEKACVGSSILSLGTILNIPENVETLEIHGDWEVIPAVSWINGRPYHYRVLRKNLPKRCDKGVTSKRRRKSA
jgi:hypothetical protein